MKRTILFALMIPLLLTGCGARRDAENWKSFAEAVETAERIAFHAEITAHWEDSSASFGADVAREGGETCITLTAPETVSGITVRAKGGETAVEFDGVILSLDAGRSETLSPCGAPQRMLTALTQGAMEYSAASSASFAGPDGESITLWRDETGALTGAELARDGRKILTLEITEWVIE
mgnify:CR=1 FL=1